MSGLQQQIGNRAVQRLIAQRSGDGPFELDEKTQARIERERGGGQPLDSAVQAKMADSTGHDLSDVKVHTSPESDSLNRELGAKAFTTGEDVFFSEGAYDPRSSGGQELIAHELIHVVQQQSGAVSCGSGMTVNAPGDAFEQEADAVAQGAMTGESANLAGGGGEIQRQIDDEEIKKKIPEEEQAPA